MDRIVVIVCSTNEHCVFLNEVKIAEKDVYSIFSQYSFTYAREISERASIMLMCETEMYCLIKFWVLRPAKAVY